MGLCLLMAFILEKEDDQSDQEKNNEFIVFRVIKKRKLSKKP